MRRDRDLHAIPGWNASPIVEPVAIDFGADARSCLGQRQTRQHRLQPVRLNPLRQQVLQRVAARRIGIGVAIDGEALLPRRLDHRQDLRGFTPIVEPRAFEMDDLDMYTAGPGNVDRLLDRFDDVVRFIAQVGEIGGIVALQHIAQCHHLGAVGIAAGRRE